MSESGHTTRIFFANGGEEFVIGGKLTILPDAVIDDRRENAGNKDVQPGGGKLIPWQANSTATTVAALREDLNRLLAGIREAGLMAPQPADEGNGDA